MDLFIQAFILYTNRNKWTRRRGPRDNFGKLVLESMSGKQGIKEASDPWSRLLRVHKVRLRA